MFQEKQKKTREQLDNELLALVHNMHKNERITIKADDHGMPGRVIVLSETVTIIDYHDQI